MAPIYPEKYAQLMTGLLDAASHTVASPAILDTEILSPELLSAVGALLPLAAYPFMPSRPVSCCEDALRWSSGISLVFHFFNTFVWLDGSQPYAHTAFWVLPLTYLSFIASLTLPNRPGDDESRRLGFSGTANIAFWLTIYQFFKFGISFLDESQIISLQGLLFASIWGTAVIAAGGLIYEPFTDLLPTIFYRFITRRVRWWYWLPNNDDEDKEFSPAWSVILFLFVLISAPALLYLEVRGMDIITEAWHAAQTTPM